MREGKPPVRAALGLELSECPRRHVPHRIRMWFDAYHHGAHKMRYLESRHEPPLVVEAAMLIASTFDEINAEAIKSRSGGTS